MKAVTYAGPYSIRVAEVEDAAVEEPNDALVRITTTNICGSDLHMYEGRTAAPPGTVLGHENMGIVEEVGSGVDRIRPGDRVSVPFNISCGTCDNCVDGATSHCLRTNPTNGVDGAAYGYANMGPYRGGQAELLRVPYADFNLLRLPPGPGCERDFALLSDVFPTGYHGTELAGLRPGESVVVFGAGPVGLLAAYSAILRGAARVFVVDQIEDRLKLADRIGASPVDFSRADPVEQILDATDGRGVDRGVEAVGYQAHDADGTEQPELVLDNLVRVVRSGGGVGVVGVYVPEDPASANPGASHGRVAFNFGAAFSKGLSISTGQCPVKRYNRALRDLIISGRAAPSFLVSHELPLDQAPDAYASFDRRVDGYTKVLLHPSNEM